MLSIDNLKKYFGRPEEFINALSDISLDKLNSDFIFKCDTLKYPEIVNILLHNGISYNDNRFELLEIAIIYKYYDTIDILVEFYGDEVNEMFEWGFEREGIILEYDYNRMAKYYIIENRFDRIIKSIFFKSRKFSSDYICKYKSSVNIKSGTKSDICR